jgi:hypothetical protein
VRQPGQPFAQQRVDLPWSELVADRLQGGRVGGGGEPVVQGLEPDPGSGGLPLGPVVAVDALRSRPEYAQSDVAAMREHWWEWSA